MRFRFETVAGSFEGRQLRKTPRADEAHRSAINRLVSFAEAFETILFALEIQSLQGAVAAASGSCGMSDRLITVADVFRGASRVGARRCATVSSIR